ncbi:DUF4249 domain-containing protein [Cryomorphaceae bacterium 1068]|nr:DUF4249 domain-containing protein [Cryomorphaceae bacterium 1068]
MKRTLYKNLFLFLAATAILSSCQDVVELDLPEGDEFLVVEGWITNENRPHDVILTTTAAYFDEADPAPVSGANVFIRDNEGMETLLTETSPGVYTYPDSGTVGKAYQLEIVLENGKRYLSSFEEIFEPVPILDIQWQLSEDEPDVDDGENIDDIYDVLIFTIEPAGLGDNYRWRSILNGEEAREPFDIFVTDDQFVDGNPIPDFNVTDELYSQFDTVVIIQERISRDAREFLQLLQTQTAFVGGPFDPPPSPIRGNIENVNDPDDIALGFFGASGRDRATIVVGVE